MSTMLTHPFRPARALGASRHRRRYRHHRHGDKGMGPGAPDRGTAHSGVNSVFSHQGIVPYDFYSLKFCAPTKKEIKEKAKKEKLGELIWGDKIQPSLCPSRCPSPPSPHPSPSPMMQPVKCRLVECLDAAHRKGRSPHTKVSTTDLQRFEQRINTGYRGNFVLDNLPVVSNGTWKCLGKQTHINNHVAFQIQVNEHIPGKYIIVGDAGTKEIMWSYSVTWQQSDVKWGHRWDAYLSISFSNRNARVHWLAIINSLLIILCLSGVVAMILLRTLHMDFNRYNSADDADEAQEEVGWKLVHGDVFRAPNSPGAFAVLIGTGSQLLGMFVLSTFFALLGFLSPANRGGLGMLYPGFLFVCWGSEDIILLLNEGANAVPGATVLSLMGLWFGISLPLVVLGASFGFRRDVIRTPMQVSRQPRQIPPQRWYLQTPFLCLVPGIIPFGAAFIELRFIMSSIWQGMVSDI
eukprot:gene26215-5973_t